MPTTFTKELKPDGGGDPTLTWNDITEDWNDVVGTWDQPRNRSVTSFTKESKPTSSFTKESKP